MSFILDVGLLSSQVSLSANVGTDVTITTAQDQWQFKVMQVK